MSVYTECRVAWNIPEVKPGKAICVIFKVAVEDPTPPAKCSSLATQKYSLPVNTQQYNSAKMSVQTPTGTISAENADNFEDIEKQFAVKGES